MPRKTTNTAKTHARSQRLGRGPRSAQGRPQQPGGVGNLDRPSPVGGNEVIVSRSCIFGEINERWEQRASVEMENYCFVIDWRIDDVLKEDLQELRDPFTEVAFMYQSHKPTS